MNKLSVLPFGLPLWVLGDDTWLQTFCVIATLGSAPVENDCRRKKNGTFVLLLIHQQWAPESSDQEIVHKGSEDGSSLSAQKEWMKQSTEIKFECSNSNFNQVCRNSGSSFLYYH